MSAQRRALAAGVVCYLIWGAIPILFIVIGRAGAGPWEILGERAVWSAPWAALLVLLARQGGEVAQALRTPRTFGLLVLSAAAIGSGWVVYVWSVLNRHNLEASLGYYITPLLNMAAGRLFFGERIGRIGWAAVALAALGVAVQAVALGRLPLISLYLAVSFWLYGLIRRQVAVEAQAGLFVECLMIAVPGLAYVLWLAHTHGGVFGRSIGATGLLLATGPATVLPLALFAWTTRRLAFSTIGFLQYLSPTIGFAVGLWVGEPLGPLRLVSFAFIWAGAATYMFGAWRAARRLNLGFAG